jgi:hypothetical protein
MIRKLPSIFIDGKRAEVRAQLTFDQVKSSPKISVCIPFSVALELAYDL